MRVASLLLSIIIINVFQRLVVIIFRLGLIVWTLALLLILLIRRLLFFRACDVFCQAMQGEFWHVVRACSA